MASVRLTEAEDRLFTELAQLGSRAFVERRQGLHIHYFLCRADGTIVRILNPNVVRSLYDKGILSGQHIQSQYVRRQYLNEDWGQQ